MDELVKWDKKSKELNNQIKNLQIDNSNLKIELEEKVKLTNRLIFINLIKYYTKKPLFIILVFKSDRGYRWRDWKKDARPCKIF